MTASDAPGGDEPGSSPQLPPNRRSTFEPAPSGEAAGADDDALAAALAEELNRATRTGAIPIQSPPVTGPVDAGVAEPPAPPPVGVAPLDEPSESTPVWSLDDVPHEEPQQFIDAQFTAPDHTEPELSEPHAPEPELTEPGVAEPGVTEPGATEPWLTEPGVDASQPEWSARGAEFDAPLVDDPGLYESPVPLPQFDDPPAPSPTHDAPAAGPPASPMTAPPPVAEPPPMAAPQPGVATPSPPPSGAPVPPPVRQSLPDDALAQWIGEGATLEAMEQLEREASLRQQDAAAFRDWEQSMLALGTPEALDAVDRARVGFSDVLAGASAASAASAPSASSTPSAPSAPSAPPLESPTASPQPHHPHHSQSHHPEPVPLEHDDAGELNAEQLADLALAPAPQSLPYSDIPPPPGETGAEGWGVAAEQGGDAQGLAAEGAVIQDASGEGIPELIEPDPQFGDQAGAAGVSSGFEEFLAETGLSEVSPQSPQSPGSPHSPPGLDGDVHPEQVDEGTPFPLAVYDDGEPVPQTIDLQAPRAFRVELAGLEPTPLEQRVGRSARLFWMWFAANSSIISVGLGAVILSLGMSLRQAIIATLVGVGISSLPLGIGALAGKRSGQPTMVVSRATFGLIGNILPALIALLTRVFWGAVLLWLLALGAATLNASTGALALEADTLALIGLAVGVVLVGVVAYFGYGLIARVQAVLTILSSVLVVAFIMLSWPAVDVRAAMRVGDGDWMLIATGAVLVFSVLGLAWAMSSSDVARYQHPHSSGAGSMLWSWAGVALPAFLLIGYGTLVAASDPELMSGLLERPLETLTLLAPAPLVYGMFAVLAVGLLSGAVMTIYSGCFALQAMGLRAPRSLVTILVAVLTGAAAAGILLAVSDFEALVRDLATTIAVPVAAWVGVFSGELMLRGRRYHWESLVRRGGVYPDVRWVNLITLVAASVVGYAFTNAAVEWLSWQGFGWGLIGVDPDSVLASTDLGVVGALVLALLVTVASAKPAITAQERDDQPPTESVAVSTQGTAAETANQSPPANQAPPANQSPPPN